MALWAQARAGLLATVVAREANPAHMVVLRFDRMLDARRAEIERQSVRIDSGRVTTSFQAEYSAAEFLEHGFVAERDGRRRYFGPDADVLLDESFSRGYCFSLAGGSAVRPEQLGLRFVPARRARGRVEIEGTLWVDTAARALRDIEFRYVGFRPEEERLNPGGTIFFREMPNGVVFIDRWSFRMVAGVEPSEGTAGPLRSTLGAVPAPERRAADGGFRIRESGAEVARARWDDGSEWRAALGTLRLRLVDPEGRRLRGWPVRLLDTDYASVTDSTGQVEIRELLPGPYRAAPVDTTLAEIDSPVMTQLLFVAGRDSVVEGTSEVLTAEAYVRFACSAGGVSVPGSLALIARVYGPDGAPASGAYWEMHFPVRPTGGALRGGTTGSAGLIHYCRDLELGTTVELRVWTKRPEGQVEPAVVVRRRISGRLTVIRVELPPS